MLSLSDTRHEQNQRDGTATNCRRLRYVNLSWNPLGKSGAEAPSGEFRGRGCYGNSQSR